MSPPRLSTTLPLLAYSTFSFHRCDVGVYKERASHVHAHTHAYAATTLSIPFHLRRLIAAEPGLPSRSRHHRRPHRQPPVRHPGDETLLGRHPERGDGGPGTVVPRPGRQVVCAPHHHRPLFPPRGVAAQHGSISRCEACESLAPGGALSLEVILDIKHHMSISQTNSTGRPVSLYLVLKVFLNP